MTRAAAPSARIDLPFVRGQFPALQGGFAFLDNAGGSQILERVVDRISDYLRTTNVQLGASYAVSARASARIQEAQQRMMALVNAARPDEVVVSRADLLEPHNGVVRVSMVHYNTTDEIDRLIEALGEVI